jgi:F-type H+-transporting ATPase subunit epsilon
MAEKIQFELVSPAKLLVSSLVDMVVVPGTEGDFGALPRHAPLIATVRPGVIDVHDAGKISSRIFVAGGFAEVNEERVTVLAEEAIPVDEITAELVAARTQAAREAQAEAKTEIEKAVAAAQVAVADALAAAAR